ncbi:hypothetical protein ES703_09179 [subsurface metagenome]
MALAGDDRKKVRAVFNRLMKTVTLNFSIKDLDVKLHKVLAPKNKTEAILLGLQITNPQSQEAIDLIEELGGAIPDTNAQVVFTLRIAQGKKAEDDPSEKLPFEEEDKG